MKICKGCGSQFSQFCRECKNRKLREKYDPEKERERQLWKQFKLSLEDWNRILESQDGKCAICRIEFEEFRGKKGPFVDHDHSCCPGKQTCGNCVRGLLCHRCNTALVWAEYDGWNLVPAMTIYLEIHKEKIHAVCN